MDEEQRRRLEERVAHLEKVTDDLSDVVASQEQQIARLRTLVTLLTDRAAEQDADAPGSVPLADQKPPHW